MTDQETLNRYLWLVVLTVLVCALPIVAVVLLRVARHLSWRPPLGWLRRGSRRPGKASVDPWKASADRLIVPLPRPRETKPDEEDDHADG